MIEAVGDHKILGMQLKVVCHYLVKNSLGDLYVWSFELNDHSWLEHPVIKHTVSSEIFGSDSERNLVGK